MSTIMQRLITRIMPDTRERRLGRMGESAKDILRFLIQSKHALTVDQLHAALGDGKHETTLAGVYKAVDRLRDDHLVRMVTPTSAQAQAALKDAAAIAARMRGEKSSAPAFVHRFELTPSGSLLAQHLRLTQALPPSQRAKAEADFLRTVLPMSERLAASE